MAIMLEGQDTLVTMGATDRQSRWVWFHHPSTIIFCSIIAFEVLLAAALRYWFGPHLREDAYITLVYAKHIAAGQGFVFNLGESVLGTTTPLYALLIAFISWFGPSPVDVSFVLGIMADMLAMVLLAILASTFLSRLGIFFVTLAYALLSPIVTYAVSGMETSFYVLLIIASLLAYSRNKMALAGVASALVVLTRPDGALVPAVLLLHGLVTHRNGLPKAAAVFLLGVAPWTAFAWAYFGFPMPQSMMAKATYTVADPFFSLRSFVSYFIEPGGRWFWPIVPLFLLGSVLLKRVTAAVVLMSWTLAYWAAFVVSNKFLYPYMPFEWYFVPLLTPFAVGVAAGLEGICRLARKASKTKGVWLQASVACLLTLAFLVGYGTVIQREQIGITTLIGGREALYARVAEHLAEIGVGDELVAANEIGSFGYHYKGPILDLEGLVSPQVLGKTRLSVVEEMRPPWIMSYLDLMPEELLDAPWFQKEYKIVYELGSWEGRVVALFRRYAAARQMEYVGGPARLGTGMELAGVDLQTEDLDGGRHILHLTLVWQARQKMDIHYTVFVHLLDPSGQMVAQHDGEPQGNAYPTDQWPLGEAVVDKHDIIVDQRDSIDDLTIVVGAYETGAVQKVLHWVNAEGTDIGPDMTLKVLTPNSPAIGHR